MMVKGGGVIIEIIFENCFMYVFELKCMGVKVEIEGNIVICGDVDCLSGV